MGRYQDALENRRYYDEDTAARGHKMEWKRGTSGDGPGNWFHGECKHCGAQMGVGWSWTDSNHPNRDARTFHCTGPGTKWQSDMQRELGSQRFQQAVSQFGQDVKDNYDREWLRGQGIEASMNRIAIMLDEHGQPLRTPQGAQVGAEVREPRLTREAHVSGNQVDVFHCPFCGSGGVFSRSDGSIECSFCNAAFTVTISPQYPAFPMSVDGQPYPWPGRPAEDPAMMGGDPSGGYGGSLIPGGGDGASGPGVPGDADDAADGGDPDSADAAGDDAGSGPPWASGGGSSDSSKSKDDGKSKDTEAEVGGKKKPPFGKKSSSLVVGTQLVRADRIYRTATGGTVAEPDLLRHLAIQTADDPRAMAERIKRERMTP